MIDFATALIEAKRKLARIIEQEGDLGGERLKPYYLQALYQEQLELQGFQAKSTKNCLPKSRQATKENKMRSTKIQVSMNEI
jgi:hypothetical protein